MPHGHAHAHERGIPMHTRMWNAGMRAPPARASSASACRHRVPDAVRHPGCTAQRSPGNQANEPFLKWLTTVASTSDADVPRLFSTSYGEDESSWSLPAATRLNAEFMKAGVGTKFPLAVFSARPCLSLASPCRQSGEARPGSQAAPPSPDGPWTGLLPSPGLRCVSRSLPLT